MMSKFPKLGSFFHKKNQTNTSDNEVSSLFKNVSLNENVALEQVENPQDRPASQYAPRPQAPEAGPAYAIGMDPQRESYRYTGNDTYLNEAGRDSDHLYIAPGEPLVPQKNRVQAPRPHYQNTYGINDMQNSQNFANANAQFAPNNQQQFAQEPQAFAQTNPQLAETESQIFNQEKAERNLYAEASQEAAAVENQAQPFSSNEALDPQFAAFKQQPFYPQKTEAQPQIVASQAFVEPPAPQSESPKASASKQNGADIFNAQAVPPKIDNQNIDPLEGNDEGSLKKSLQLFLFIRQLLASFFTHTTLNILAPKLSLKFGPTYPSSMPVPYFFVGLLLGALCSLFNDTSPFLVSASPFILTLFLLLTGIQGFRGCGTLMSIFSQRRSDSYMKITCVLILTVLFCLSLNFAFAYKLFTLSFSFVFASILMLSAYTATTLNFALEDDPVDTYGSLSLKGLLISGLLCFVVLFLCLSFTMAISLIGSALLVRMIIGYYLNLHKARASRDLICGMQYITMLILLLDMLLLHLKLEMPLYSTLIAG